MWEETLGFFALLVPLALALGYDRMVAAAIIFLGAGTGVIASTVNPFATGVASDAAGISIGDGIGLRIALWLVLVPIAIGYVVLYARRIRNDPARSVVGISAADAEEARGLVTDVPGADGSPEGRPRAVRRHVLGDDLRLHPLERPLAGGMGPGLPAADLRPFYFPEAAALFLVMAVVIGLIAKLGEEGTVNTIVAGAGDFLGAALIIVLARGITVVMKNAYMTDTILHCDGERGLGDLQRGVRDRSPSSSTCRSPSWSRPRPGTRRW